MIDHNSGKWCHTDEWHYWCIRCKNLIGHMTDTGAVMVIIMRGFTADLCRLRGMYATTAIRSGSETDFTCSGNSFIAAGQSMTPADGARLQQQCDH